MNYAPGAFSPSRRPPSPGIVASGELTLPPLPALNSRRIPVMAIAAKMIHIKPAPKPNAIRPVVGFAGCAPDIEDDIVKARGPEPNATQENTDPSEPTIASASKYCVNRAHSGASAGKLPSGPEPPATVAPTIIATPLSPNSSGMQIATHPGIWSAAAAGGEPNLPYASMPSRTPTPINNSPKGTASQGEGCDREFMRISG